MNITDSQAEACEQVVAKLKENGIRAISDLRNEKIGFKIRERTLERIPYLLVLGDREVEEGTVNVRTRSGKNLGTMSIDAFVDLVKAAVAERGRYIVE
jgi:threonyl-tRNA synthetase